MVPFRRSNACARERDRGKLAKCFVLFETGSGAKITDVEVYDGEKKIADSRGLPLDGKHTASVDSKNLWKISPPKDLILGVAICVRVHL